MPFVSAVLFGHLSSEAQTDSLRSSGVIPEDTIYDALPTPSYYTGQKEDFLPMRKSLRHHCPPPGDQFGTGACGSWATAYSALTTQMAYIKNITNPVVIHYMALSPLFIHSQVKKGEDCMAGAFLSQIFQVLVEQGVCRHESFNECENLPNSQLRENARSNKIKSWGKLFEHSAAGSTKVDQVRRSLGGQNPAPVIISIKHDTSFWEIPCGAKTWAPSPKLEQNMLHALVVIGYDDHKRQFECMNSYGSQWADDGFVFIRYEDFGQLVKYGIVMEL